MFSRREFFLLFLLFAELSTCGCLFRQRWPVPTLASPPPPPPPVPQFSVVWSKPDLNGIPMNPEWAEQRDAHQLPPVPKDESQNVCVRRPDLNEQCTAQHPLVDDQTPNLFWRAICALVPDSKIHGHVDWMPATYYGAVNWIHMNFGDADYNLRMFPYDGKTPIQNGLTVNNNNLSGTPYIEMEFDSNETSGRFRTPTWKEFDDKANSLNPDDMKAWLDPQHGEDSPFAVVTGLFNLDCEHDCRSELHPLYALAVERDPDPNDNNWAILVRNWGDGGSCSGFNQQLDLPRGQYSLVLPKTVGNPSVIWSEVEFAVSDNAISFPKMSFVSGVGFVLTFTLPDPSKRALVELALHLKWPAGKPTPPRMKLAPVAAMAMAMASSRSSEEDAGSYVGTLFERVAARPASAEGRLRAMAIAPAGNQLVTPTPQVKVRKFRGTKKDTTLKPAQVTPVADTQKQRRDTAMFWNLCAAYRSKGEKLPSDKVPELPKLCESLETNSQR